jgi:uncharacterized membrane protein required for colicin V production
LQRIGENNKTLGIFFGCLSGMIIGIILVIDQRVTIAIIGVPQ